MPAMAAASPQPSELSWTGGNALSATQTFTFTNSGGRSTGTMVAAVPSSSGFSITDDSCTGRSLASDKSCVVTVAAAGEGSTVLTVDGEHASASAPVGYIGNF
jgi:secreted trypsin-like serine protease